MESYKIENLSFTYPNREYAALENINFTVNRGEFITVCGPSGCGKTTLFRLLKPALAPTGNLKGNIFFEGKKLSEYDAREQASKIGFVMQNPDNQIVTDKVWHELAFGLESLGVDTDEIRARVAEMASFFGIQNWFHKKAGCLSGGQKQILNLASIMVMQPSVLILDEPCGQLDPISAQEFLNTLEKINRELGTTVILSEHRLEETFSISDRVIVMDSGKIIADTKPEKVGKVLKDLKSDMYLALPAAMRVFGAFESKSEWPITVREGKNWLEEYAQKNKPNPNFIPNVPVYEEHTKTAVEIKDAWFRYEKNLPDVIKGLNIKIKEGELFAIVGGNGAGKSTALSLIAGLNTPYRGDVFINGQNIFKICGLYDGVLGVLPQNPQSLFSKKTVYLDLMEMVSEKLLPSAEKERKVRDIAKLCRIDNLLESHPYDLSGGEQQRAALAKILLKESEILILDEPTKGMDAVFKEEFAKILKTLKESGVTIIMVSHDIEFCAEHADRCAMFFDGSISSIGVPREFFAGKNFYTTSANRMARTILEKAVTADDIILAFGGEVLKREGPGCSVSFTKQKKENILPPPENDKLTLKRIIAGSIFALMFIITSVLKYTDLHALNLAGGKELYKNILQLFLAAEAMGAVICFFPQREIGIKQIQQPKGDRRLTKRTAAAALLILALIPLTIYTGIFYFGDRKYYFISLIIILETMIPFAMIFESRRPKAREIVIISVLCAIAVAGRAAFAALPQFKPVVAVVIIAGVCFGGEAGFLVGAVTGFVSNFFFGQGPWTPWQMFAFGIIGFAAGVLFKKGFLRKTKASLCIFGFLAAFVIYGGIMNPSAVITAQNNPTFEMITAAWISGMPFDLIHAAATAFFLWFISEAMIDKLERIKVKYGLI